MRLMMFQLSSFYCKPKAQKAMPDLWPQDEAADVGFDCLEQPAVHDKFKASDGKEAQHPV